MSLEEYFNYERWLKDKDKQSDDKKEKSADTSDMPPLEGDEEKVKKRKTIRNLNLK